MTDMHWLHSKRGIEFRDEFTTYKRLAQKRAQ
jgi:hypothetical protein